MWTSLHSCVEVRELNKLSFQVTSVVGPGIGVLDGVDMLQVNGVSGEEGVLQSFFSTIRFNGALLSRNVLDSCVKS